jgi:hypothetical protein
MDFRHLDDRLTVLDGTHAEFQLLGQGLNVVRTVDDDAQVLEHETPWPTTDYVEDLMGKLPQHDRLPGSEERFQMTVDVDELTTLCGGLRLATNHAVRTRTVLGAWQSEIGTRLTEQIAAYRVLRTRLLPGVRYDTSRA